MYLSNLYQYYFDMSFIFAIFVYKLKIQIYGFNEIK